jgi:hypothetical protein
MPSAGKYRNLLDAQATHPKRNVALVHTNIFCVFLQFLSFLSSSLDNYKEITEPSDCNRKNSLCLLPLAVYSTTKPCAAPSDVECIKTKQTLSTFKGGIL